MKMTWLQTLAIVSILASTGAWAKDSPSPRLEFNIPAQSMSDSLNEIAERSNLRIIYFSADTQHLSAPAVSGTFTAEAALQAVLANSGLWYLFKDDRTVQIRSHSSGEAGAGESGVARRGMILAHNPPSAGQEKRAADEGDRAPEANTEDNKEQEIVVTGTQIRNSKGIASPISVYTRDDIDRTGAGSVQQFMRTLPENFSGGASEGTVGALAGGGTANNQIGGTGVNLRGLGNDATLVLLNGRRLTPGNTDGNFVDVSMIPLAGLKRVEVVPDGASALYGSDAVGGVVNFIMRKDFTGAETRARYGTVTEGNLREYQLAQTVGFGWGSGSALLSYEYFRQKPLELSDKSWVSAPAPGPFDLLPEQKRHGVFASFSQSIGGGLELFADATYANRSVPNSRFWTSSVAQNSRADIDAFSMTAGTRIQLAGAHELELAGSYGASSTDRDFVNLLTNLLGAHQDVDTSVAAVDGKSTGTLFPLPAGPVSYAAGLHLRKEAFNNFNRLTDMLIFRNDRKLWAGFLELRAPLIAAQAGEVPTLELTLAGRYEHYNDFGSTSNPKIGLTWTPSPDIRLRGTWGTSFKAPLLSTLDPVHSLVVATRAFDPGAGALVPVFLILGGNPALRPEEARSWTVGADWTPDALPGLTARVTYYDISYTDRITTPQLAFAGLFNPVPDALRFESLLAQFITRNPTAAQLQAHINNTVRFADTIPGGVNLQAVAALIDYSSVNLSSDQTSGVDFGLSYAWDIGAAAMTAGFDGTYILELDRQLAPGVPIIDAVDTVFNPAALKLRARAAMRRGGFSAALFINHVDSYKDTRGGANIPIASWTTVDTNIGYELGGNAAAWNGTSVSIGATNLFDKAPPGVAPSSTVNNMIVFDGANADVRGRFIYVQIAKRF